MSEHDDASDIRNQLISVIVGVAARFLFSAAAKAASAAIKALKGKPKVEDEEDG